MAIGFDFGEEYRKEYEESRKPENDELAENVRNVSVYKTMSTTQKMRLLSESALDKVLPWHLEKGNAYHVISCGDVDSLTFLRHIVKDNKVDYAILSTWCMSTKDAEEMLDWIKKGYVKRFDFYVGEIFKNGYRGCLNVLDNICAIGGGRVARFRNHSKIMIVYGRDYDCVVESSANVNTNPRTEQTCITVDSGLADFYKEYFDGVNDFDGRYKGWEPYEQKH